jgi:hypothetical protein
MWIGKNAPKKGIGAGKRVAYMDADEWVKSVLTLLYEIDDLEKAQKCLQSAAEVIANRQELSRLRSELSAVLAEGAKESDEERKS